MVAEDEMENVAIIGMAGRFPMAGNVDQFWENIRAGRECISFFDEQQLQIHPDQELIKAGARFVAAKGVLDNIEDFDAKFWGYTPKEAELIDPQQRIFLECAWEALENAGYDAQRYPGAIGVYGGCYIDTYLWWNLASDPNFVARLVESIQVGSLQTELGNDKDYIATRASFKMDLRGPAINVQSACSTSLVAISLAYQSLTSYQCDMALAGGVTLTLPQEKGYFYTEGGMLSRDGHCRTFDKAATGTVFSNAGAVILLKRESDAIADGDNIIAVIKGAALNNDGGKKLSYTAPSVDGQAEVIATAQALGGVDARTIGYVEAHGTATPLGDPIEVAGLTSAFRQSTSDNNYCALGSVKSNLGHLDVASGVTGVIKCALMLKDKVLAPSINFEQPNPEIDFENTPFYVNTELKPWPEQSWPRRAGISSFGVGGTNAHVVLEEAPAMSGRKTAAGPFVFPLSARSPAALANCAGNLAAHLREAETDLGDVAFTLQEGRRQFEHRAIVVAADRESLLGKLAEFKARGADYNKMSDSDPRLVFMFPGQGAQYPGMARDMYESNRVFRKHFDECAELLGKRTGIDLHDAVYKNDDPEVLKQTSLAQPAIFAIEYAMAMVWMDLGIEPAALVGHSVGEYCAGCISGVMSLDDALYIVAKRGALMQDADPGAMLSVRAPLETVRQHLPENIDLAAHNSPELCVVSGPDENIQAFAQKLEKLDIPCSRLHTSHAFHSSMMDAAVAPTEDILRETRLSPPKLPIMSTVDGGWLTDESAVAPAYWGRNLRDTVLFAEAVANLLDDGYRLFLEVGPGQTLSTLAKQCAAGIEDAQSVSSLPHVESDETDSLAVLSAFGRLWLNGKHVDWGTTRSFSGRRVPLPTYPFERKRFWVEPGQHGEIQQPVARTTNGTGKAVNPAHQMIQSQVAIMAKQLQLLKKR